MPSPRALARSSRGRRHLACESLEPRTLLAFTPGTAAASANTTFDPLIHAAEVRNTYNIDGTGLSAAVIDTGIDYHSAALGGGFGTGYKVSGGVDLAMHDPDPNADTWSHGTNVAGLIASQRSDAPGVAPGANLVALRVFGNDNSGDFSTIADALQWVVDNHDRYHITVVNLSVSDGGNYARDWYSHDGGIGQRISGLIDRLTQLRVPVVAAAGNSFAGSQGMGFVAILPGTISVTASSANDHLLGDAQRLGPSVGGGSATDLAAPGQNVQTVGDFGGSTQVSGTSFAAPLVSGAIVLLQQLYQSRFGTLPAVADVVRWLKDGADPIFDGATGITIGRLDVARAASLVPRPATSNVPSADPVATSTTPGVISSVDPSATQSSVSLSLIDASEIVRLFRKRLGAIPAQQGKAVVRIRRRALSSVRLTKHHRPIDANSVKTA